MTNDGGFARVRKHPRQVFLVLVIFAVQFLGLFNFGFNSSFITSAHADVFTISDASGTGTVGQPFSGYTVTATGTGMLVYLIDDPTIGGSGLTFNIIGGVIEGTPTSPLATTTFTITEISDSGPANQTYDLTINAAPGPLSITAPLSNATLNGQVGTPYSSSVTSSGGIAPVTYAVSSGSLPNGLTLASGGAITGTPTVAGTFTVAITATDSDAPAVTSTVTHVDFVIAPATLAITAPLSNDTINGQVGIAYSSNVTSTGGVAPVTYEISSGTLPLGLTLASGGAITGTPTTPGTFTVNIKATDSHAPAATSTVTSVDFVIAPAALAITAPLSNATLNGQVGIVYSSSVTSAGGVAPVTYAVTSGTLPNGLSLAPGGAITGTPTVAGTFTVDITATDSDAPASTDVVTGVDFVIAPAGLAITAPLSNATLNGQLGVSFSSTVTSSGGVAPVTYEVSSGSLPNGLNLAPGGAITGTPTVAGTFTVSITATDSDAPASTDVVTGVDIVIAPAALEITAPLSNSTLNGQVGSSFSSTVTSTGGVALVTYTVTNGSLPAGLTLSLGGSISGTPTSYGTFTVSITATDSDVPPGTSTVTNVDIVIAPAALVITAPLSNATVNGTVGVVFSSTVTSTGGVAPVSYSVTSGTLPTGLSLGLGGSITGTPVNAGTSTVSITAIDSDIPSAEATVTSVHFVIAVAVPPVIPDPPQQNSISGITPSSGPIEGGTIVNISGSFPSVITTVQINGESVAATNWSQTSSTVTIRMPAHAEGDVRIQLYNGQVPLMVSQGYSYLTSPLITPTPTASASPTPTASASPTPTSIASPTSSPTPTSIASPTSSPTPTSIASPTSSPTPTPTTSASPTPTPTTSASPTPTPTTSASPTPTPTTSESPAPTPTPTTSASLTPTPTTSESPTPTTSESPTPRPTPTTSASPTSIPTRVKINLKGEFFNTQDEKFCLTLITDIAVGSGISSNRVNVYTTCAMPYSTVTATLRSDPTVIGTGIADSAGVASFEATLPVGIPAGIHTITADAIGTDSRPLQVVSAFELNNQGTVLAYAPPAVVSQPVDSLKAEIERALATGKPIYDPKAHPGTVAALAVVAITFLGAAGVRKFSRIPEPVEVELASVKTKALKSVQRDKTGWGDLSKTWKFPGTLQMDSWISAAIVRSGRFSAILPRVLVDGSWARAVFGSAAFGLWGIGFIIGIASSAQVGFQALPPTLGWILIIVALSFFDSAAGALAWFAMAFLALVNGHLSSWSEIRTILGMFVLFSSIPLLAHAFRPLRRSQDGSLMRKFDRLADYVMPPVFLSLAASSMFKALNGLSGLELVNGSQIGALQVTVVTLFVTRLLMEDLALHLYPQRSLACQPGKLEAQTKLAVWFSVVLQLCVFILIATPFFGLGNSTLVALGLATLMLILDIYRDSFPNFPQVNKWYPRGIANFLFNLVTGAFIGGIILGSDPSDQKVRSTFALIMVPGIIFSLIQMLGRKGHVWPDNWSKRIIGIFVWLAVVGIVLGVIPL